MAEPAYSPVPDANAAPDLRLVPPAPPAPPSASRRMLPLAAAFLLGALVSGLAFFAGAQSIPQTAALTASGLEPPERETGALYDSIADLTAALRPAVVTIEAHTTALDALRGVVAGEGAGSGVIFDPRGFILTNKHVVAGAQQLVVTLTDGRRFRDVKVAGVDDETDLAVLRIEGDNLPHAALGDSDRLRVGDRVVAMGNAQGRGETTVSAGVVAALERAITTSDGQRLHDLVQTDAAINPGNSGGPLLNMAGEVIGITTAMDTRANGIGFAVSSSVARPVAETLAQSGRIERPWIGVLTETISPALAAEYNLTLGEGLFVTAVARGGPADRAGLRPGSVVLRVDDAPVQRVRDLQETLRNRHPGDAVALLVRHDGAEQRLTVAVETPPPNLTRP